MDAENNISISGEGTGSGRTGPAPTERGWIADGETMGNREPPMEEEHVKNGRTMGDGPRPGPWHPREREGQRSPEGGCGMRRGPGMCHGQRPPYEGPRHPGPEGGCGMRSEGHPGPWGPGSCGRLPFPGGHPGCGEGAGRGWMPGNMPPPRFHHRPAMSPGFEPEAERRERYASLDLKDKITFQLKALGHILRMMPETRDGQNRVLSILLEKGTMSQRELMELAEIRSASLSELVGKLEMNGYVRRFPNPRDGRSLSVCLTEAGSLAARALRDNRTDLYEGMSEEELKRLLDVLEKLGEKWHALLPGAAARKAPLDDKFRT